VRRELNINADFDREIRKAEDHCLKNKYLWVGIIAGTVLFLDQYTKYLVETRIRLHEVIPVVPGFFNLTHVRNPGAAFSLLADAPAMFRTIFFLSATIIAVAVIIALVRKTHEWLLVSAFALIMGGALGNVIDRVRYGEVVDFIQWFYHSYYWPSFNIADSAITIAVVLLAIEMLFAKKPQDREKY
jgi:signal peptidase II